MKNIVRYFAMAVWNYFFSYFPSAWVRWCVLKYIYKASLQRCNIHAGVKMFAPWYLTVGEGSNIQHGSFLDCRGKLYIGENVDVCLGVKVLTQDHDVKSVDYLTRSRSVSIGDNCVIGSFATLLPGSVMKDGAVLGASAVLAKTVNYHEIVVGNPPYQIGLRPKDLNYRCSYIRPFY